MWRRNIFSLRATRIRAAIRSRRRTTCSTPSTISASSPPPRRRRRWRRAVSRAARRRRRRRSRRRRRLQRAVRSVCLACRTRGRGVPAASRALSEPADARRTRRSLLSSGSRSRPSGQGQNDRGGFQPRQDRQGNRFPDRGPRQDRPFGDAATDIGTTGRIATAGRAISARIETPGRNHSLPARTRPRRSAPRRCRRS